MKNIIIILFIALTGLVSCNDEINVKQDYDFSITVEKYRKEIAAGETVGFVFHLNRNGNYALTHYTVNCFIREGEGTIRDKYGNTYKMNTDYPVNDPGTFTLFYTSQCSEAQRIELVFKDSFGKSRETVIELQNKRD